MRVSVTLFVAFLVLVFGTAALLDAPMSAPTCLVVLIAAIVIVKSHRNRLSGSIFTVLVLFVAFGVFVNSIGLIVLFLPSLHYISAANIVLSICAAAWAWKEIRREKMGRID